jgi:Cytochrome c oxidase subunit III
MTLFPNPIIELTPEQTLEQSVPNYPIMIRLLDLMIYINTLLVDGAIAILYAIPLIPKLPIKLYLLANLKINEKLVEVAKSLIKRGLLKYLSVRKETKNIFRGDDTLLLSITLGVYFLILQGYEYATVALHINDSVFGSIFYMLTGLHGLHVIVGVSFLSVILLRNLRGVYSWANTGLSFGAWYWHFVDVVWILLYILIYLLPAMVV